MQSLDLRADARQSQVLSPRLQQAVRLLQLSSLDYAQVVHEALHNNPFLEGEDLSPQEAAAPDVDGAGEGLPDSLADRLADAPLDGAADDRAAALPLDAARDLADGFGADELMAAGSSAALDDGERGERAERVEGGDAVEAFDGLDASDREFWQAGDVGGGSGARGGDGDDLGALDHVPARRSLAQHLHEQLVGGLLAERQRLLAGMIVDSLDDDGYLRIGLPELAEIAVRDGFEPAPSDDELAQALQAVQALEPAGVAARDVAECLRLQLPGIACPQLREQARRVVDEHLGLLAARDVPALARVLGCSVADAGRVCERIRRLDPRPGWRMGSEPAPYVVPDVIVQKVRGQWTVKLNPAIVPRVRLNRLYADLLQRARRSPAPGDAPPEAQAELSGQLQEARWTVRNVEQRFGTILGVAEAIVKRQKRFFDYGPMAMKPLGLQEIADELGMHESTVSRVTNNKYLASPLGVFELKHFFSRAMATASGGECTGTAIRGLIQEMVAREPADAPLSDVEIARRLTRQGLQLARRTVTKYRQMLKIDPVERRRRSALVPG